MLVNPAKHAHVKKELGQAFIDWVISKEGQDAIRIATRSTASSCSSRTLRRRNQLKRAGRCDVCALLAAALLALMPMTAHAETVNLYAAGSLKAALTDVARAFESNKRRRVKVETTFAAIGHSCASASRRGRLHMCSPPPIPATPRSAWPITRLHRRSLSFARNELCALAQRGSARLQRHACSRRMLDPAVRAWHIDAEGRSVGRLCLRAVCQGGGRQARRQGGAGSQGAAAHRRPDLGERAGRPQPVCLGDGQRQGRRVSYLLHQRGAGEGRDALAADRRSPARRSMSARTMGWWYSRTRRRAGRACRASSAARMGKAVLTKHGFGRGDPCANDRRLLLRARLCIAIRDASPSACDARTSPTPPGARSRSPIASSACSRRAAPAASPSTCSAPDDDDRLAREIRDGGEGRTCCPASRDLPALGLITGRGDTANIEAGAQDQARPDRRLRLDARHLRLAGRQRAGAAPAFPMC